MLYRDLHNAMRRTERLQALIQDAVLAGSKTEMLKGAERAQAEANELVRGLQGALARSDDSVETMSPDAVDELAYTRWAVHSLQQAASEAETSRRGDSTGAIRVGLLNCLTRADLAGAFLRAAVGDEETAPPRAM